MRADDLIHGLPGENLVREGVADVTAGRCTTAACLVAIAGRRLVRAGIMPRDASLEVEPERQLYRQLLGQGGDAYSRYNALLRELISFEQALARRLENRHGQDSEVTTQKPESGDAEIGNDESALGRAC